MRTRNILPTALICLMISCLLSTVAGHAAGKTKSKEPAPRFNATTTRGEKFNNDSIKGKVVLLEFWTTWCGYCLQEAGFVDRINDSYANKGLVILAINVGESKKTVKKYLEQHPRSTRIVLTDDTNLAAMFEAKVYPIYVVIDRDGNVAGEQRGAAGEGALRDLLASGGLDDEDDDKDDK
ncbi:MAG TPA: TlpA disulfide reductase family protein [Candidatus Dormibacteraeota bacterium]|nr:TlpA disulfide reductase family protein [Candidatus Dormibacteraeota bacterium]